MLLILNMRKSKTCLSIPPTTYKLYNNNKNTTPAVKNIAQSAKALGMSSRRSVTNGKAAQHAAIQLQCYQTQIPGRRATTSD